MSYLTVFAVVFKPKKKMVENLIQRYSKTFPVIIINNSLHKLHKNFYNKKNLTIIDNEENNGNGAGINIGLKLIQTKLALYIDLDAYISLKNLSKLIRYAELIKNFGVLISNASNINCKNKIFKTWNNEGSVMLFNLDILKNKLFFDEKYFLYFEENDFFFNCLKKKINVFFLPKVISSHARGTSIIEDGKISELRAWHYSWSCFYFYKKNFNYYFAIKKNLPSVLKNIIMIFCFLFTLNFKEIKLRLICISGFVSAFICLSSWKRNN